MLYRLTLDELDTFQASLSDYLFDAFGPDHKVDMIGAELRRMLDTPNEFDPNYLAQEWVDMMEAQHGDKFWMAALIADLSIDPLPLLEEDHRAKVVDLIDKLLSSEIPSDLKRI